MKKGISILVGVILILFAASSLCIGSESKEADKAKMGGVIRFAIAEESRGLDPVTSHRRFSETAIHVQDGLVLFDENSVPIGQLAESWKANEDATEYTIKLRKNVVFHDGSRLTGNSIKAHFKRVFDPAFCCSNAYQYMGPYADTEIIDDYTIKVKFSKPWGPFNYYIGLLDVTGIPSDTAWKEKGDKMNLIPVGAGPFKFVEWVPQSHIKYERYEEYNWGASIFDHPGPPYVDGLEVKFISDQSTRVVCLESGDCDIIKSPPYTDMRRLRDKPDYKLVKIPETGMPFSFVFNTAKWPTNELEVRKAINLAIDREKINIAAFLGEREPLYTTLTSSTPEFWPGAKELIYFDPAKAKQILGDAGWKDTNSDGIVEKDGKPLAIDLYIFGSKEANPSVIASESMQADLKAIGVAAKIHVRPWDDQSVIAMKEEHHLINFDMPLPTASVLGVMFNSRETPREGHYGMGFTWFQKNNPSLSKKLDTLLDAGDNAPNLEKRKEKFIAAQKIISENYLGVPISAGFTVYAMVKNLTGVKYNNAGHAMFNDAYFSK